jgi:hypothetical protein
MSRTTARPTPNPDLPELNTLIRLTIGSSDPDAPPVATNVPSRIEDVRLPDPGVPGGVTELFVAVPRYPGDVDVPEAGTACTVTWAGPTGVYDLPVGYRDRAVLSPAVQTWRVAVTGAAVRAQRRHFVRVPWAVPIVVELIPVVRSRPSSGPVSGPGPGASGLQHDEDSEGPARIHGMSLDLGEGGLRCRLPPPQLRWGQPVRVSLEVDGEQLQLEGTVVRSAPRAPVPGREAQCDAGIAFTAPDEYGDLLRRAVFTEQLRGRRAGTE